MKASFPRHGEDSAVYVDKYLNGDYGQADDVAADLASLGFALDRFVASKDIIKHLEKPKTIVISDRYVASNLAHQGTKFDNKTDRHDYYQRNMKTEYELFGIPKPDLNIVLKVPTEIAQANVDKKNFSVHSYTEKKRDIHEANASHLNRANFNYSELCDLYPSEFKSIECVINGEMRSIKDIHQEIVNIINSFFTKSN
jgi:dTMP kinase